MKMSTKLYHTNGLGGIFIGERLSIVPDAGTNDTEPLAEAWGLLSGVYTPRQLVQSFSSLLDAVVSSLGKDSSARQSARHSLLDNMSANLSIDSREATLRLSEPLDDSRREIRSQADRIGRSLVTWAREFESKSFNPELRLRSPCEGHLLTPKNVDLMFGDQNEPHLMQIFNEYMHQMVILRDALLPFQNYQDVLIPVDRRARGLRHLEQARSQFLAEILTKHATQKGIVSYAKRIIAPELASNPNVGYGFQYKYGCVLPAFLSGGPTPLHLLQYIPSILASPEEPATFDYVLEDYYSAPRATISNGITLPLDIPDAEIQSRLIGDGPGVQHISIQLAKSKATNGTHHLNFVLELDSGYSVAVDLGQVSRGHRYSYFAEDTSATTTIEDSANILGQPKTSQSKLSYDALGILGKVDSELLTAEDGLHIIPVSHAAIALAISGKLYPQNTIFLPKDEILSKAKNFGKGFGPKFIIWGGSQYGGPKGTF